MSTSTKTILVVDDEKTQRDLMRQILRPEYTVLEASDFADALAVQKKHLGEIDLLLIDVRLPGGNGYDLSTALLAIEPHLRTLFVSGQTGAEAHYKFSGIPVTGVHFLQKPFHPVELLGRVKFLLSLADPYSETASA